MNFLYNDFWINGSLFMIRVSFWILLKILFLVHNNLVLSGSQQQLIYFTQVDRFPKRCLDTFNHSALRNWPRTGSGNGSNFHQYKIPSSAQCLFSNYHSLWCRHCFPTLQTYNGASEWEYVREGQGLPKCTSVRKQGWLSKWSETCDAQTTMEGGGGDFVRNTS